MRRTRSAATYGVVSRSGPAEIPVLAAVLQIIGSCALRLLLVLSVEIVCRRLPRNAGPGDQKLVSNYCVISMFRGTAVAIRLTRISESTNYGATAA